MIIDHRIRAAADGDNAALVSLTDEYREKVKQYIRTRLCGLGLWGFRQYVDDLLENPHLVVWEACKKYKHEYGTFAKHLHVFCNNAATNAVRTPARRSNHSPGDIDPDTLCQYTWYKQHRRFIHNL